MKIFFDYEFTGWHMGTNHPKQPISVGFVREDGRELYIEFPYVLSQCSCFVLDHVLPLLEGKPISENEARKKILTFVAGIEPTFVCDYEGDASLLGRLFQNQFKRVVVKDDEFETFRAFRYAGIDEENRHHALVDARQLKVDFEAFSPKTVSYDASI